VFKCVLTAVQTKQQILQRRLSTLLELSEEVPRARSISSYWSLATEVLSHNDKDVPFALLYSVESEESLSSNSSPISSQPSRLNRECVLRGSLGLDDDSPARPVVLDFEQDHGFMPYFRQAMCSQDLVTVQFEQGTPAAELVRGVRARGFGDPCRAAAICAVNPMSSDQMSSDDNILGFLVIGLNSRTPYNDDYRQFILVASRLLSTSLTSILLHEEEISRRERMIARAETMKIQLTEQLLITQKEVERNNLKFQRFAERADIGIFIIDMDGVYTYRNDAWYGIFQTSDREMELDAAWDKLIDDEYAPIGKESFALLMDTKEHQ
jgi:PAS domain-containing protein